MMQLIRSLFCTVTIALPLVAAPGFAAVIEVGYKGTIQGLDAGFADTLPLDSPIRVGAPVIINYAFESTTPDTDASPTSGIYIGALTSFTVYIGAQVFDHDVAGPLNEIDVFLDSPLTIYQPVDSVIALPALSGFPNLEADIIFLAATGSPLADDSLPLIPPDPLDTAWDSSDAAIYDATASTLLIDINLTSLCSGACAVPPVPVPAGGANWVTVALMIVGTGLLLRRHRTA